MRLGHRRPGTSTAFVDASSGEVLLRVASDDDGRPSVYFHLYDSSGRLTSESRGLESFPGGIRIQSKDGELLLDVPTELAGHIQYRLYNRAGALVTCSDGARTQIQGLLRMEADHRR